MAQKTALVTGASRGIGRGIALELARAGCRVAINYAGNAEAAAEALALVKAAGGDGFVVQGDVAVAPPVLPVVNNVDVKAETAPDAIRDALYRQAYGAVRWVEVVQAIRARGITHIVECGPGKVLAGMVKRIASDAVALAVYDPATLAEAQGALA